MYQYKDKFYLSIIVFLLIFIIIITDNLLDKHSTALSNHVSGIAKILDGDTITINSNKIRLLDIDAPEWNQTCTNSHNQQYHCGIISKNKLKELTKNKIIKCIIFGYDYYNRLLGRCYHHSLDLNKAMVVTGWAIIGNSYSNYRQEMLDAKKARRGIWQGEFITPRQFRKNKSK